MASLSLDALLLALADGILTQPEGLTRNQREYLRKGVVIAADSYHQIAMAGVSGLGYEQFASRMAVSQSTAMQYAKWLEKAGLITIKKQYYGGDRFGEVDRAILRRLNNY